ncbi:MAG: MATE family efflux transporter, partial [Candidatus Eremiobacteraeota bacterium]|nr:MATE family efflux transporter [Candidatus Eremiobacteraeota bacterium]
MNIFDESKPMWRLFLTFLIPMILSNALQSASQTSSSIFLGRMIGVHALAAVSSMFPIVFFLISFLIGLSSGSTVLIGQAFGARQEHTMKKIAGTTLSVSLALGVSVGLFGVIFARPLLQAIGTPPDILADAVGYSRIIFAILPIFFPYIVYTTFLRGTGDSATPFYSLIVSTALSILFTPALIRCWFGLPQLGVESAAVSGFIANVIAFSALLVYLGYIKHPLKFDGEMFR